MHINNISVSQLSDSRGTLQFANEFNMMPVKRFYIIHHPNTKIIRAWQGHKIEQKWFFVLEGSFQMYITHPDNWEKPSPDLIPESFFLQSRNPEILHVPAGYATGFKAMTPDAKMIVYSNLTLEESKDDDFRFPSSLWIDWELI